METIQLTLGQIYAVISVTATVVAGVTWWVWKIVDNVKKAARSDLDQHQRDQSKEIVSVQRTMIDIMDARKADHRAELDKLWARTEAMKENAVHKSDLQDLERKLDARWNRIDTKLDEVLKLTAGHANHEARIVNIESVMKMD